MSRKKKIELTELQNEFIKKITEVATTTEVNTEAFVRRMLTYISTGPSRTFFLRDLLNLMRKGQLDDPRSLPAALHASKNAPIEPAKALITAKGIEPAEQLNEPVPAILSGKPIGDNAMRFNLPTKKKDDFDWQEDLPAIQKLILNKAFTDAENARNSINLNQLATNPKVVDFLRGQVDFVIQTIDDAKEKIGRSILGATCPRCKKRIDFWGMQKSNVEEIIVFYKNANSVKKGEFFQVYHRDCLIQS